MWHTTFGEFIFCARLVKSAEFEFDCSHQFYLLFVEYLLQNFVFVINFNVNFRVFENFKSPNRKFLQNVYQMRW